jgi:hypothetical protein
MPAWNWKEITDAALVVFVIYALVRIADDARRTRVMTEELLKHARNRP